MPDVENWPDAPVPDPSDLESYNGLNDQLLAARHEAEPKQVTGDVPEARAALVIYSHHPCPRGDRFDPRVYCATPACSFEGTVEEHSVHVAKLVLKAVDR